MKLKTEGLTALAFEWAGLIFLHTTETEQCSLPAHHKNETKETVGQMSNGSRNGSRKKLLQFRLRER